MARSVFVTGGSGYMGARLVRVLLERGHRVRTVARAGSEKKIPAGCEVAIGNVLDGVSYQEHVRAGDTLVHLVGVAHPSPAKAQEFKDIDLRSAREAFRVAKEAGAAHVVYVSVAQPSPVMKAYVEVRRLCEAELLNSGIPATILRPFYVLGPGHYWPCVLKPMYWVAERAGPWKQGASRLGLVSIGQMLNALVYAVENRPERAEVLDVPKIRTLPLPFSSRRAGA